MQEFVPGLVSICTTTYNRPNFLNKLIETVLSQTYENWEMIIYDNSENDDTKVMCQKFQNERIRYYKNKKNIGMGKNALKAFSFVRGEYMTFTPDDDYWDKNNLEKKVTFLNEHKNINIVFSNAYRIDYVGNLYYDPSFFNTEDSIFGAKDECIDAEYLLPGNNKTPKLFLCILTAMLRSKNLLDVFKESYHLNSEEYLCWYIGAVEEKVGFIYDKLVYIREAEHYREVLVNGKIIDWKVDKRYRQQQLIDIYRSLIIFHPESSKRLMSQNVSTFVSKAVISEGNGLLGKIHGALLSRECIEGINLKILVGLYCQLVKKKLARNTLFRRVVK